MNLFITVGCSGVGKSTWTKNNKVEPSEVICPDEVRKAVSSVNDQSNTKYIFSVCYEKLRRSQAETVYFDATSLSLYELNLIVECVPGANTTVVLFENSLNPDFCFGNVKKDILNKVNRSDTPEEVIKKMSEKYKKLTTSKEFSGWISSHNISVVHVK